MPAQALRFKQFGWYAPQVSRYAATANAAAVTIPAVGGTWVAGAVTPSQFSALVAGVSRAVSAASVTAGVLTLTLASALTNGQVCTVAYAGGGAAPLKDGAGNLTPPFTIDVKNNTP